MKTKRRTSIFCANTNTITWESLKSALQLAARSFQFHHLALAACVFTRVYDQSTPQQLQREQGNKKCNPLKALMYISITSAAIFDRDIQKSVLLIFEGCGPENFSGRCPLTPIAFPSTSYQLVHQKTMRDPFLLYLALQPLTLTHPGRSHPVLPLHRLILLLLSPKMRPFLMAIVGNQMEDENS